MTVAGIETAIWEAQRARVEACPQRPAVVLYPDSLQGAPETMHLEVMQILGLPSRIYLADGMPHERRGTLQLLLKTPVALVPMNYSAIMQTAGELAAYFKDGTCMAFGAVKLKVVSYPEVSEGFREDGWWVVPIRIRWETAA